MNFSNRHDVEEYLSGQITDGAIVEIGCGFGNGLLALNRGNQNNQPIYAIDPYVEYSDPLGGKYGPETKEEMLLNTQSLNFTHIEAPSLEALKEWSQPIGLLWVDLSQPYVALKRNLWDWLKYVIPGGYVAITGLSYNQLGTRQLMDELIKSGGYYRQLSEQNFVAVLKKSNGDFGVTKRAVFYIAGKHRAYVDEAKVSARSAAKELNVDTFLFTPINSVDNDNAFTKIYPLPDGKYDGWYRNQVWYFNMAVQQLKDYDQLLYLDTDTFVCRDCSGVWAILDHYDMALGHAAGRGATPTAVGCPSEFATLGVGANFFNNTPKMRDFFVVWQQQFDAHYDTYQETDEGPMRDLLFLNEHNVSYFVLAPEEHCRFGFGVWLNGAVSILHGRVDTPLDEIAREVNAVKSMRLYRYQGKGENNMYWYYKRPGG